MTTAPTTVIKSRRTESPEGVVRALDLPPVLADLVLGVVRRCRLWKGERAEVARELGAHMADALEAGDAIPAIVERFGDPARAAVLLTRAKKRLRPMWWRAMRRSLHAMGALVALAIVAYAVAAARYYSGSPSIRRNYMKEMNASVLATPADQRAWPVYIEALREFGAFPEFFNNVPQSPRKPGDPSWDEHVAWVRSHEAGLALVRLGASRPSVGYVVGSGLDPEYVKVLEAITPTYKPDPQPEVENPLLVGVLLPHLGEMRKLARVVALDAHAAAAERDRARFVADVAALLGIADQNLDGAYMISGLVGCAVYELARTTASDHLLTEGFLTEDDLRALAHRFGARSHLAIDVVGERRMFDDIIQRFYSDDGHGDGRLVRSAEFDRLFDEFGIARPKALPAWKAYQPIQSLMLPSRKELSGQVEAFAARAAADEALPSWRHDERAVDRLHRRLMGSGLNSIMPILAALQGDQDTSMIANALASRDRVAARRDAFLVVIALELHRRRHGSYPQRLDELVPGTLPEVPPDPMDGRPMRYRPPARPGERPMLYSVGCDGVDDGGVAPTSERGREIASTFQCLADYRHPREFTAEERAKLEAGRGDWIFWPEPAKP